MSMKCEVTLTLIIGSGTWANIGAIFHQTYRVHESEVIANARSLPQALQRNEWIPQMYNEKQGFSS